MARRKYLSDAELAEFDAEMDAIWNRKPVYSPTPETLPEGVVHFEPVALPTGAQFDRPTGWFYTSYNPETHEGEGWFGTEDRPSYDFENELREDEYGDLVLMSRNCGYGEGCFWSEWR